MYQSDGVATARQKRQKNPNRCRPKSKGGCQRCKQRRVSWGEPCALYFSSFCSPKFLGDDGFRSDANSLISADAMRQNRAVRNAQEKVSNARDIDKNHLNGDMSSKKKTSMMKRMLPRLYRPPNNSSVLANRPQRVKKMKLSIPQTCRVSGTKQVWHCLTICRGLTPRLNLGRGWTLYWVICRTTSRQIVYQSCTADWKTHLYHPF